MWLMKTHLLPAIIAVAAFISGFPQGLDYRKVHANATVVDTHNDIVQRMMAGEDISVRTRHGQSDIPRFRAGGVAAEVFSIWVPPEKRTPGYFTQAGEQISCVRKFAADYPDQVGIALSARDIESLHTKGKIAIMMGMEGGHPVGSDTSRLRYFYDRGIRYLTLTWNNSTSWATSARDEEDPALRHRGLTPLGRIMIRKMNEIGLIIDVSHAGDQTLADVLAVTKRPVIASHSSVWTLCHNRRNLKDDQIRAIARTGGLICINFGPWFIDSTFAGKERKMRDDAKGMIDSLRALYGSMGFEGEQLIAEKLASRYRPIRPPLKNLIDHIDYAVRLVGADHVGIGSDFDGISVTPLDMDDVTYLPGITRELLNRGYSEENIRKILGGNFLRVLRENGN